MFGILTKTWEWELIFFLPVNYPFKILIKNYIFSFFFLKRKIPVYSWIHIVLYLLMLFLFHVVSTSLLLRVSGSQLAGVSVGLDWFLYLFLFCTSALHLISWMTCGWILLTLFARLYSDQLGKQLTSFCSDQVHDWFRSCLLLQGRFISALWLSSGLWQNTIKGPTFPGSYSQVLFSLFLLVSPKIITETWCCLLHIYVHFQQNSYSHMKHLMNYILKVIIYLLIETENAQ